MPKLNAARTAQTVLSAEFAWEIGDTMVNTSGVEDNFASAAAHVFDVINLPPGAILVGGELVVETAFNGTTYPVVVGDSVTADRYLATADRKAAGRTALTLTGRIGQGEPVRVTITPTGTTTAGKARLRVLYVVDKRANEAI